MNGARMGVATSWNMLVNHCATAEYCILINDDVFVVHHWIDTIVYTLKNNQNIGVVGLNAYEGENSKLSPNNIPTYVEANIMLGSKLTPILSARGYAFGFRRSDYIAVNGFDQNYFYFFEEIDFNLSMMKYLNKRNCILSYPIVMHMHGATTFKETNYTEVFECSKKRFEEKWQTKWEDIRTIFNHIAVPEINTELLNEWNSNVNIWG